MKRIFSIIFLSLSLIGILVGCSNSSETTEQSMPLGAYVMEESEDVLKPYLVLKENNEFSFTYSPLSGYFNIGSYEESDGKLILDTRDSEYKYVFKIEGKDLIFNLKESLEMPTDADLPDGAIFSFSEDYLADRAPFIGIGYDLDYKEKIFPNMTEEEIQEAIDKIMRAAREKAGKGEKFKITEEELEKLNITGLDPQYLDKIKISTE